MIRARFAFASATAFAGLAVLTACGSESPDASAPAAVPASQTSASGAAAPGLSVAEVGSLGKVVTAADGKTLYLFAMDTTTPPASKCDGECATLWPPVIAGPATANVQGIDKSLLGTVKRTDGSEQVTIKGHPVYEFAKDSAPGEVKGQGVKGTWFAISPTGEKAVVAAPSTGQTGGDDGGY